MSVNDLIQDIQTLTPAQRESVYSFVFLLKNPDFLQTFSGKSVFSKQDKNIEPFSTEKEALDFVNDYTEKILHETWCGHSRTEIMLQKPAL